MFATVFVLLPTMASVGTVLLLLYYFYAIIGMEAFASATQTKLTDCCNGSIVENNYKNNTGYEVKSNLP